uniref:Uncharacterized protein n=1 Tax=Tanacetum cinerariifolium TaxID=118510 RepID=A0A6L2JWV4_TANCI|nr:hypothetical protein [Tanacetum cinerariifolium]
MELKHHVPVYVSKPVEDPEEDPIDYVADADDDKDDEEESFKDDDDEEEEHLASPAVDLVLSAKVTKSFETNESAATTPPPPTYRTNSRMSIRSQEPIPFPSEAEVDRLLALPTLPPSPLSSPLPQIPSPPLPIPSSPITSPTYLEAPLGYKAFGIRLRATSPLPSPTSLPTHHPLPLPTPSTSRRANILEANIPPRKRL